jgi:hypothetical protein
MKNNIEGIADPVDDDDAAETTALQGLKYNSCCTPNTICGVTLPKINKLLI